MPAAFSDVQLMTDSQSFFTLFIPPRIMLSFATRRRSVGGIEGFRIAASQVFKLIPKVRVDQFGHRLFRDVVVHQPRNQSIRNEGQHKEANPRDVEDARFAFKHVGYQFSKSTSVGSVEREGNGSSERSCFQPSVRPVVLLRHSRTYALAGASFTVFQILVSSASSPPNMASPAIVRRTQNGNEKSVDASHGSRAAQDQP